jgi:hypothetical protein
MMRNVYDKSRLKFKQDLIDNLQKIDFDCSLDCAVRCAVDCSMDNQTDLLKIIKWFSQKNK